MVEVDFCCAQSPVNVLGGIELKTRKEEGTYLEMRLSQTLPAWALRNVEYHMRRGKFSGLLAKTKTATVTATRTSGYDLPVAL